MNKEEIEELNRIVTMYLDYAEYQTIRHQQIYMKDWREKLDAFLKFNEHEILDNPGKISKEVAEKLALKEYVIYHQHRLKTETEQDILQDDKELKYIQIKIEKKLKKQKKG